MKGKLEMQVVLRKALNKGRAGSRGREPRVDTALHGSFPGLCGQAKSIHSCHQVLRAVAGF